MQNLYEENTSKVSTGKGTTGPVPLQSGIKKGCTLSGLLFNYAIDHIIREAQGDSCYHKVLAFADDLCVLADTPEELQVLLDGVSGGLRRIGMSLNPNKCCTVHISGRTPVGVRDSVFLVDGVRVRSLSDGEATSFLGAEVGFKIIPHMSTIVEIIDVGLKVLGSKLAP